MNCPHWSPVRDLRYPRDLRRLDTKLRVLVGGMILGRGAAVRALLPTCAPSPCASKVRRKPEACSLRRLGPPRTERVRGVASVGRAGEVLWSIFGSGGPESACASQSTPGATMGSSGTEPQSSRIMFYWLRVHACMTCMCVVALAPGNTPRAKARPTQDGRRGLQRQRERDGGCRATWFRRKTRGVFIISSKAMF